MSLRMNSECLLCHLRRNIETAESLGDEQTAMQFAKELMKSYLQAPDDASSPSLGPGTTALFQKYYGLEPDRFRKEKEDSNRFMLERMDGVQKKLDAAEDPLLTGLQYAILGNYIDFSALQGKVSFQQLDEMLDSAQKLEIDRENLEHLRQDLKNGKKLLYITDNAGEICLDRLFAEKIGELYPRLEITFCVRGGPAANDATREDALLAGIRYPIIDNGTTVPGTDLHRICPEARQALEEADVLISKGQGNTETLLGCGYNLYYAFLIKCPRFEKYFKKPLFTPMLVRERSIKE